MNRQVDVKALVSHVIRGDGVNKCRICMGDTSEGQVYLSDTVIMEGDKPVTLSELLEVVTGIQVPLDGDLPAGVCVECSACAVNAANFRAMCRETSSKWHMTLQLLCDLPSQFSEKDKILFVIMDDNQMILVIDEDDLKLNTASERLGSHLSTQINMNSLIDVKSIGKDESHDYNDTLDTREWNENEIQEVIEDKTLVARRVKTEDGVPKRGKNEILDTKIVEKEESEIKCVNENERLEMKRVSRQERELKDFKDKRLVTKKEESEQKYLIKTERRLSIQMPQCPNCNKKFLNPLKLYHHLQGSIDMTRACHICCKIMSRDKLVSHLSEVHNIEVFDCKKCPAVLLSKNKYIQHLNKAHAHGACSCIDCGQTFQSHQAFNAHMSVHRRKSCPSCDKIFQNQTCYLYHVKRCCNLDKNIKTKSRVDVKNINSKRNIKVGVCGSTDNVCICDYCGKRFAKKKYVTAHIQIVHMKNTHAPCAYCGKLLATAHMTEHLKKHELNLSFKCQHCGIVLKSKLGYVQHLRLHTGERPYGCKICKETFSASSRRSEHMRKVHQDTDVILKHACKLCPAKFPQLYRLKKHMKSAHINECDKAQTFECAECHENFGSCRGLLHHSRTHQKVNFPYRRPEKTIMLKVFNEPDSEEKKRQDEEQLCPQLLCISCTHFATSAYEFRAFANHSQKLWTNCVTSLESIIPLKTQKSFYAIVKQNLDLQSVNNFEGSSKELVQHLSNRLKRKPLITERKPRNSRTGPSCECTDCGKSFSSPYFLNVHLRNSGRKEACWLCGVMLIRGLQMKEHLTEVHKTDMFLCPECPLLFKTEAESRKHKKKCHSPGKLTCNDCGRTFQRHASFEVHSQMHNVRTCRACGVQFTNRGCYREHRQKCEPDAKPDLKTIPRSRRSNIRDPATFTCDYCNKTYHSRPQLKNHILWIHMDIRPHQCQWCGKRFYTPARLAEHTVVHTRVRNFECDICGAKLVSKMAAVYHRRRHTGEKPYECADCGEKFISSSRRSEHAKRRHNKGLRIQCTMCASSFVRSHELRRHMDKAHNPDSQNLLKIKKVKEFVETIT